MKRKISALTLISIVLMFSNLGVQVLLAASLGAGAARDALFVAMSVPLFLNTLMLSSMGVIVTPAILKHSTAFAQRRMVARLTTAVLLGAGVLAGCLYLGRDQLLGLLAPGFSSSSHALAAQLSGFCSSMIPLQAANAVLQGYWIARERIFLPSLALLSGNLVTILVLLRDGSSLTATHAAAAVFLSAAAGLLLLTVAFVLESRDAGAETQNHETPAGIHRQIAPLLLSSLVGRSTSLVERRLASSLNAGTLSCLSYAGYLMAFLVNATTAPAATAYYAQLCQHWNEGNLPAIRTFFYRGLRLVLLSSLAASGVVILAFDAVLRVVLPWTQLTLGNASELSHYVNILMGGYVFLACASFSGRIFYAAGKFMVAAWLDCAGVVFYVVIAPLLLRWLGGTGLALAMSLYACGLSLVIFQAMKRLFGISYGAAFWAPLGFRMAWWLAAFAAGWAIKFSLTAYLPPLFAAGGAVAVYGAIVLAKTSPLTDRESA